MTGVQTCALPISYTQLDRDRSVEASVHELGRYLIGRDPFAIKHFTFMAYNGMLTNLLLAIFNLIPVAPLDGAAVLSGLLPRDLAARLDRLQSYSFMLFILLIVSGIPSRLFGPPIFFLQRVLIES